MVRPAEGKRSDDADEFCADENADACQELRARFLKIARASSSLSDEYSVAGIVLPTVNFLTVAGQYQKKSHLLVFRQLFCSVFPYACAAD